MVCLLAAAMPYIVMTGMHHALTPIFVTAFATTGQESLILIAQVCANLAQGGATLAVALKSKDKNIKQLASAAWISAVMGITEPALYGVTLKLKKPAILASIGAGIAGLFAGISVEIRFTLHRSGEYKDAKYYIGYIQMSGKGEVCDQTGTLLVNRELHELDAMAGLDKSDPLEQVFTLFYKSLSTKPSQLKFVVMDNFKQSKEYSISFENDSEEADKNYR